MRLHFFTQTYIIFFDKTYSGLIAFFMNGEEAAYLKFDVFCQQVYMILYDRIDLLSPI